MGECDKSHCQVLPSSCGRDLLPSQNPCAHYKGWKQAVIPTHSHLKLQPQLCQAQPPPFTSPATLCSSRWQLSSLMSSEPHMLSAGRWELWGLASACHPFAGCTWASLCSSLDSFFISQGWGGRAVIVF